MKTPRPRPAQPSAPAVRVMYEHRFPDGELTDIGPDKASAKMIRVNPRHQFNLPVLVIDLSRKEEVVEVMAKAMFRLGNDVLSARLMRDAWGYAKPQCTNRAEAALTALQQHAQRKKVRSS